MKHILFGFCALSLWQQPAAASSPESDRLEIEALMNDFSDRLREKSVDDFLVLFQSDDAPFMMPVRTLPEDMTIDSLNGIYFRTARTFIEGVSTIKGVPEEKFFEPSIDVHDDLATFASRYEFTLDGRLINDGVEIWSLIKTDSGWKIVSVMWTQHIRNRD